MDKLSRIDWSLLQAFLAVAEEGSLSAAARRLGASQPTLGRQIRTAEGQLGVELFHRRPRGLELTEAGAGLLPHARQMADAVQKIALTAAGQDQALHGTVRITASVMTSVMHLPAIIAHIRLVEPEIAIELVPSDSTSNLLYREADIAVRMFRPTQLELVTRHLGDLPIGLFASRAYAARRGLPATPDDLMSHDVVGYDQDQAILDGFAQLGWPVTRDFFKTRCDENVTHWNLIKAGCGIGFMQADIGRADPDMIEIDLGLPLPSLPIWLTAHEAMRQTPRVRRVWDLLADGLLPLVS